MNNVPTPDPAHDRINDTIEVADGHLLHTCCGKIDDGEHRNFCPNYRPAASDPAWTPKLLPCPAWCATDHTGPGEDDDLTESWNLRLHTSRDLLMIRRQVPADAPEALRALPDRVAVSVCVAVTDNVTDGTRGEAGIMVETGDALTIAEGRRLIAAVGEGLRILDPPTGYAEGFLDGYTAGRKRQD